jgi:hypothetical protein
VSIGLESRLEIQVKAELLTQETLAFGFKAFNWILLPHIMEGNLFYFFVVN